MFHHHPHQIREGRSCRNGWQWGSSYCFTGSLHCIWPAKHWVYIWPGKHYVFIWPAKLLFDLSNILSLFDLANIMLYWTLQTSCCISPGKYIHIFGFTFNHTYISCDFHQKFILENSGVPDSFLQWVAWSAADCRSLPCSRFNYQPWGERHLCWKG